VVVFVAITDRDFFETADGAGPSEVGPRSGRQCRGGKPGCPAALIGALETVVANSRIGGAGDKETFADLDNDCRVCARRAVLLPKI